MSLEHVLNRLMSRVATLERQLSGMVRHGTVAEVDAAAGTVRLKLGETDGTPYLSPPIAYGQMAGSLKVHTPMSVGQQMTMFAPSGDFRQAVAMPMTWSNQNQSPSSRGDENALTFGPWRLSLEAGKLSVTGPSVEITGNLKVAGNVDFSGGYVKSEGKRIDNTHTHTGVVPGGGNTGTPN